MMIVYECICCAMMGLCGAGGMAFAGLYVVRRPGNCIVRGWSGFTHVSINVDYIFDGGSVADDYETIIFTNQYNFENPILKKSPNLLMTKIHKSS